MSEMTRWEEVGKRVRQRREDLGWTQTDLGRATGNSKNQITRLEGGEPVSEEKLSAIAGALQLSLAWLRYGVASHEDLKAIYERAYEQGARHALDHVIRQATAAKNLPVMGHEMFVRFLRTGDPDAPLSLMRPIGWTTGEPDDGPEGETTGDAERARAEQNRLSPERPKRRRRGGERRHPPG
jgi:transcriptional regulator with XRE-family HTH domain